MSVPAPATVMPSGAPRPAVETLRALLPQLIEKSDGFREQLTRLAQLIEGTRTFAINWLS